MMINLLYIIILLVISEYIYFRIADRFNIVDKPNLRSSHRRITLRGGGVIFSIGICLYCAFYGLHYTWFFMGLIAISAISFIDDVRSVPNRLRIGVHFMAMLLMFYQWNILTNDGWIYIIPALILCIGIINAFNFMDGINGITGGYSLVVLVSLAIVNNITPFVNQEFIYVSMLSVVVFCFFNFRTRAKCFAGDVGAVSIAFIILFILGSLIISTGNVWYLIFLVVYGVDSTLTICHRLMLRENIFKAHRKHMYQLMANELHMPHIAVATIYMLLQLAISLGAIYVPMDKWLYFICIVIISSCIYLVFKHKYYHLHEAYLAQKQ